MISPRKLIKMAKKWQKIAIRRRKRIAFPESSKNDEASTSYVASKKGHFVIYTADNKRFIFPLNYLENSIIRELLEISEEEFGLPRDGPIRLPCDTSCMQQIVSMIQGSADENRGKALLMAITTQRCSCSSSFQVTQIKQQFLVSSY